MKSLRGSSPGLTFLSGSWGCITCRVLRRSQHV
jgi:hypothetical protein